MPKLTPNPQSHRPAVRESRVSVLSPVLAGMLPGGADELVKLKPQFKVVKAGSRRLTVNPPKAKK